MWFQVYIFWLKYVVSSTDLRDILILICRCCVQFTGLWKGGSCSPVLGSYICCFLNGWMDYSLPQLNVLKVHQIDALSTVIVYSLPINVNSSVD